MTISRLLVAAGATTLMSVSSAASTNLIVNGDFTLSHAGTTLSGNPAIPDSWSGIQTQTTNARVLDGAMLFSTAHPTTNISLYKDYIYQSFVVPATGVYTLIFDYKLEKAQNGWAQNGAKVYVDQFYASAPGAQPVVVPNMVFKQTYGDELLQFRGNAAGLDQWHLGQSLDLSLSAGSHTLYLSSGTGDFINQYGARVWFDNVSLTTAVPENGTAALSIAGLLALSIVVMNRPGNRGASLRPTRLQAIRGCRRAGPAAAVRHRSMRAKHGVYPCNTWCKP